MTRCPQCGGKTAKANRFCTECGVALDQPPPPRSSFRWLVLAGVGLVVLLSGVLGLAFLRWYSPVAKPVAKPSASPSLTASALTATPPMTPTPSPRETPRDQMRDQLEEYYHCISAKDLARAYAMRSQRARGKTTLGEFQRTWENNRSVRLDQFRLKLKTQDKASVEIRIISDDLDKSSGKPSQRGFRGQVSLAFEGGRWCYDGGEFTGELQPQEVVEHFYRWYLPLSTSAQYRRRLVEASEWIEPGLFHDLRRVLARGPSDGAWIDVDPFCDSQMGIKAYSAKVEETTDKMARVRVEMTGSRGDTSAILVELAPDGQTWRITDWVYGGGSRRLSDVVRKVNR